MNKQQILDTLVLMLVTIDHGMVVFDTPLPEGVGEGIKAALSSFGVEALPVLEQQLTNIDSSYDPKSIVEVIGLIGDQKSTALIIDFHENHSTFLSGLIAMNALRRLGTQEAYLYMSELLSAQANGDQSVFNSGSEMVVACISLGEWQDIRAISPLIQAVTIRDVVGMPDAAINALAKYTTGKSYLTDLASNDPSIRELVSRAIKE